MSETIIIALISLLGTLGSTFGGIVAVIIRVGCGSDERSYNYVVQ